jgi:hypothetical protein
MRVGEFEAHVTVRCDGGDAQVGRLERRAVADLGVDIAEAEQEFVVYDGDMAVDEGWIVSARRGEVAGR